MQQLCNISSGPNYQIALIALLIFGVIYNALIAYLEKRGWERGITALLVALGDGVTLVSLIWLANFQLFAAVIGLFVASGTPMIIGSLYRYVKEREAESEELKKAVQVSND